MTALPVYVVLVSALAVLSIVDVRERRLPKRIVHGVASASLVWFVLLAAIEGAPMPLVRSLACGAAALAVAWALHGASPTGLGFGDVRLVGLIALDLGWLGTGVAAVGLLAGVVLAGLAAAGLVLVCRRALDDGLPLGPFLATGALVGLGAAV